MSYICIKKLSLSGKRYYPGDTIPDDAFLDGSAAKLIKSGYVSEAGDLPASDPALVGFDEDYPALSVVFTEGETSTAYPVNTEQLQAIADTMQRSASDAADCISRIQDETVLVFILKTDSRKTVREAAQKRLALLISTPGLPGQSAAAVNDGGAGGISEQTTAQTEQ